jgi:hypothetical protein
MQHIKSIMHRNLAKSGISINVNTALIIDEIKKSLVEKYGVKILPKVKPLYIKNNILTIACLSSVLIQEITLNKQEIISRINNKFQQKALKDIRFIM